MTARRSSRGIIERLTTPTESSSVMTNLSLAFFAQGSTLVVSIAMSLVVPKLLGLESYSYWQTFLLYAGFVGLTLFGVNDGLYLRLGGSVYGSIDRKLLKGEYGLIFAAQFFIAGIFIVFILTQDIRGDLLIIGIGVCFYCLSANSFSLFGYTLQAVNLTHLYSIASLINKIVFVAALVVLFGTGYESYAVLITVYVLSQVVASLYMLYCLRDLFKVGACDLRSSVSLVIKDIESGIKVMVAFYASSLIVGFARIMVELNWSIEEFGLLSFALSTVSFVLAFIGQISMVMFPVLRRMGGDEQKQRFFQIRNALVVILPLVYVVYPLGAFFLTWWLPDFSDALLYLGIAMPICVFDGKFNLLYSTYLKVLRDERYLLLLNVAAMVVGIALSLIAVHVFKSIIFVAMGVVASIVFRSVSAELFLARRRLGLRVGRYLASEVCLAIVFITIQLLNIEAMGLPLVWCAYLLYLFFNRGCLRDVFRLMGRKTQK